LCSFSQSLNITHFASNYLITKYCVTLKREGEKREKKSLYQTASVVLRELVDRDLGFITILILKRKKEKKKDIFKYFDQYISAVFLPRS
jgi:hypothetical protein